MYYAIYAVNRYIPTAFNSTSTFEVREKLFASLSEQIGKKNTKPMTVEPLEDVLGRLGLKLHKQDEPFVMTKRFRVIAAVTTYCYLNVDANNEQEARRIAEETDGGDYYTMEEDERPGSFIIEEVNLIS